VTYWSTRFRTEKNLGQIDDMLVLSNLPTAYIDDYIGQRLFEHEPIIRGAQTHSRSCMWSWFDAQARTNSLSEVQMSLHALNQSYGLRSGVSLAFPENSARSFSMMNLCAELPISQPALDEMWNDIAQEVFILASVFHMRVNQMPHPNVRQVLTKRQREVLEWVGDGKTTATIATIMGLTPTTVEKHLRLAREALDVETTAQAVLKASIQKQIYVLPHPTLPDDIRPPSHPHCVRTASDPQHGAREMTPNASAVRRDASNDPSDAQQ
jgi:LuxR family transcriptional regulator